jgi:hypothetical protein
MTQNLRRRTAFTLVEMLVASAIIIFMMYIIASAFEKGLTSFSVMKTQGDMQDKLRAAATTIRMDLTAQHFGDGSALSDQRLNDQTWQPQDKGYVRISQPGTPGTVEGVDPDNPSAPYYRLPAPTAQNPNPAQNTYMQFTVNLTNGHPSVRDARGRRDQFFMTDTSPDRTLNQFSAPDYNALNGSTAFTSYWAEVTYFVKPQNPAKTTDATSGVPLYNFYRRQVLLVDSPTNNAVPAYQPANGNYLKDVSIGGNPPTFNRPTDVTEPLRRWGSTNIFGQPSGGPFLTIFEDAVNSLPPGSPYNFTNIYQEPTLGPRIGGDLLLTNVVNFEIKVLWEPVVLGAANATRFNQAVSGNFISPNPTNNPDYPFDYLPVGINPGFNTAGANSPRVFDTWSANNDPNITNAQKQPAQSYGPPTTGPLLQPEYGAWNGGHFTPLPASTVNPPTPTATQFSIPLRVRVRAVQIKLRIWDQKSSQTRQMTIIQDL